MAIPRAPWNKLGVPPVLEIRPVLNLLTCRSRSLKHWFSVASGILILAGPAPLVFAIQEAAVETQAEDAGADAANAPIAADLFQFPPTEPEDLIRAARMTQRLDRLNDSRAFLRRFIELGLSEVDLRAIRTEIGTSEFLALRLDQRLSPEAEQILKLVNQASAAKTVTTEEMQSAATKILSEGFAGEDARRELVSYPDVSTMILLEIDPATPEGEVAESLLEENVVGFRNALLAAVDSSESSPVVRARAIRLLGLSADKQAGDRLLRWQFSDDVTIAATAKQAFAALLGTSSSNDTAEGAASYLTDNAESLIREASARFSSLQPTSAMAELKITDPRLAAMKLSSELLGDALILTPGDSRAKSLLTVANAAMKSTTVEAPSTISDEVSTEHIVSSLAAAIELNNGPASVDLLKSLMNRSLEDSSNDSIERVIRSALNSPDPAVRFLAAMNAKDRTWWDVSRRQVEEILNAVKNGSTMPEAVVVTGDDRLLDDLQFTMQQAGYHVAKTQSSPDGFDAAAEQMNCELFLVSAEVPIWPLAVTLANLRADLRTRSVPIVVFGPPRFESKVAELAKIYPGVWFSTQPIGTSMTIETREATEEFGTIKTPQLKLQLQLGPLNLPEPSLSTADRAAMKAMLN